MHRFHLGVRNTPPILGTILTSIVFQVKDRSLLRDDQLAGGKRHRRHLVGSLVGSLLGSLGGKIGLLLGELGELNRLSPELLTLGLGSFAKALIRRTGLGVLSQVQVQ